ncbi:predicted protein [Scheffersomyces stipitis CBS 6054]|uniref:Uncharacterized protein n=1 Tax=Scheffersomyces stipitis (strain ATCC 58785 / CBS 6054 / NBRC 10063 / NRRL Y-11545) TaxID=322104 RepID=A3LRA2_PICST|nr:predicted protein [Scheffersomyces stipitis CBS 6054]ABN65705.2 predicted protein [Scheffersomyces stipitis CBS 6054]KAG2733627.1 hypothetical protein G9P44_003152 [Scheffersomyces stipitis]
MNIIDFDATLDELDIRFLDPTNDLISGNSVETSAVFDDKQFLFASLATPFSCQPFKFLESDGDGSISPTKLVNPRMRNSFSKQSALASPLLDNTEFSFGDISPTQIVNGKGDDLDHSILDDNEVDEEDELISPHSLVKPKKKSSITKYKINKSFTTSPTMKAPLKPTVTIASIDTYSQLQKKNAIEGHKRRASRELRANSTPSIFGTDANRKLYPVSVGNPFYRPIKFRSSTSIPTLERKEW